MRCQIGRLSVVVINTREVAFLDLHTESADFVCTLVNVATP